MCAFFLIPALIMLDNHSNWHKPKGELAIDWGKRGNYHGSRGNTRPKRWSKPLPVGR